MARWTPTSLLLTIVLEAVVVLGLAKAWTMVLVVAAAMAVALTPISSCSSSNFSSSSSYFNSSSNSNSSSFFNSKQLRVSVGQFVGPSSSCTALQWVL